MEYIDVDKIVVVVLIVLNYYFYSFHFLAKFFPHVVEKKLAAKEETPHGDTDSQGPSMYHGTILI